MSTRLVITLLGPPIKWSLYAKAVMLAENLLTLGIIANQIW